MGKATCKQEDANGEGKSSSSSWGHRWGSSREQEPGHRDLGTEARILSGIIQFERFEAEMQRPKLLSLEAFQEAV